MCTFKPEFDSLALESLCIKSLPHLLWKSCRGSFLKKYGFKGDCGDLIPISVFKVQITHAN